MSTLHHVSLTTDLNGNTKDLEYVLIFDVGEINDGGSSGIPDGGNVEDFYRSLKKAL